MIIKRFDETTKIAEILRQHSILHVDQSAISRSTLSRFLALYNFIIKNNHSVVQPPDILPELKREAYDCIIINYATCQFDFCILLKKIKKLYPNLVSIIYNFSHSRFEKYHLLKSGLNALLPTDFEIHELLYALHDMCPNSYFKNKLVTDEIICNVENNIIANLHDLTPKEILFIRSSCNGLPHKEIGKIFFNSKQRVDNIFHQIRVKIGCDTPIDFLRFALMYKIIDWNDKLFENLAE